MFAFFLAKGNQESRIMFVATIQSCIIIALFNATMIM